MATIMNPHAYLRQIYRGRLDSASLSLMAFYARVYKLLKGGDYLEFGGGPTIYSIISAAANVSRIHLTDYDRRSLHLTRSWVNGVPGAFDWSAYTRSALRAETGIRSISGKLVEARHGLIREKIKRISRCDAFAKDPLLQQGWGKYDVIATNFCLEGITADAKEWRRLNNILTGLLAPSGLFVTTAICNARGWLIGRKRYPAVRITTADLIKVYHDLGIDVNDVAEVPLQNRPLYDGIGMISGVKVIP